MVKLVCVSVMFGSLESWFLFFFVFFPLSFYVIAMQTGYDFTPIFKYLSIYFYSNIVSRPSSVYDFRLEVGEPVESEVKESELGLPF